MEAKDRIKYLRKSVLHMTQEELGSSIGLSRANIANIESGRIALTDRVMVSICREFSVNEDWLRTGNGEPFVELSRDEEIAAFVGDVLRDQSDSFKKRYIKMLSSLDENGWKALEQMMDGMKGD